MTISLTKNELRTLSLAIHFFIYTIKDSKSEFDKVMFEDLLTSYDKIENGRCKMWEWQNSRNYKHIDFKEILRETIKGGKKSKTRNFTKIKRK